jgi:hypothetical protein
MEKGFPEHDSLIYASFGNGIRIFSIIQVILITQGMLENVGFFHNNLFYIE